MVARPNRNPKRLLLHQKRVRPAVDMRLMERAGKQVMMTPGAVEKHQVASLYSNKKRKGVKNIPDNSINLHEPERAITCRWNGRSIGHFLPRHRATNVAHTPTLIPRATRFPYSNLHLVGLCLLSHFLRSTPLHTSPSFFFFCFFSFASHLQLYAGGAGRPIRATAQKTA